MNRASSPDFQRLAADPELAGSNFERFMAEKAGEKFWESASPPVQEHLIRIFGFSQVLSRYLIRRPESAYAMEDRKKVTEALTLEQYAGRLETRLQKARNQDRTIAAFRFKYEELLRTTANDLSEAAPYEVILEELSSIAESLLDLLVAQSRGALGEKADSSLRMVLLGQGKLGSRELNFSSDVDVQFIFAGSDESASPPPETQELATRWARAFLDRVQATSDEGFLYRVDVALRPEGASGPLVNSLYAAELYYETWGLPWERFALLRARPCGGDRALGERFLKSVEPFVYKKYLSLSDVGTVKKMKDEQARQREQPGKWNVKLGVGGIRDVEFFVQGHQVLNAGKRPVLRTPSTFKALEVLAREKFISPGEARQLSEAYVFLRRLENHLQMVEEQQTQGLPSDRAARLAIARSMNYARKKGVSDSQALNSFEEDLQVYTTFAKEAYERFLSDFSPQQSSGEA